MKKSHVIIIFLSILLIFLIKNLSAQEMRGSIMGKVVDKETYQPLPGVNIFLEETELGAASNGDGEFRILNVPPGKYILQASMVGYKIERKDVIVKGRESMHLDIELEIAPIIGEEVVVTGTRTPKAIKDVPVRTEIITPKKIKEKSAVNLYEALEAEPGIRVEQQCSNCNFSILRVEGLPGGYTQTLIDGQPIFTGLAGVYGLQQIQTGNIERIEVVKGSGSALYGSDAMGGVVNVIIKEPSLLPTMNLNASLGEFGTNHFSADGSMRRGKIGAVFSVQKDVGSAIDQTGGGSEPPFNNIGKDNYTDRVESDNFGGASKLHWYDALGANSKVKISGRVISEFRRGGNFDTWEDPFDVDSEQIRTVRYETGIGFEKEFIKGEKVEFNYNFVNHDRNATNGAAWDKALEAGMLDDDLNLTPDGQAFFNKYGFNRFKEEWYPKPFILNEKLHIADIGYSQSFRGMHMFLAGMQYRKSNLDQSINGEESDKHADDLGIYVQGDFFIRENMELVSGVRYDKHKSEDNLTRGKYNTSAINPRVALRYSPYEDFVIRVTVGTGFKVPYLFSEDLHLCASAPRIFKGPDLKSERALSLSLGADLYKVRYRVGLNIFRTNIKDKIEFISAEEAEIPPGFDYKWSNVGNAYTQGVEVVFTGITMNNLLDYHFDIAYIDAKFDEYRFTEKDYPSQNDGWKYSNRIPRSPNWTGSSSLTFKPRNWQFLLNGTLTGSMYIDHCPEEDANNLIIEKTDPYFIFNAKITRMFGTRLSLFIGAKNLFNYVQKNRDSTDAAYIYAPLYGRIIYTGINLAVR